MVKTDFDFAEPSLWICPTVVGKLVDRIIPTLPRVEKDLTVKSALVGELIALLQEADGA